MTRIFILTALVAALFILDALAAGKPEKTEPDAKPKSMPGEVQCANLIYGKNDSKTSVCFADQFLRQINQDSNIRTTPKFTAVRLASEDIYDYPFSVMTGEGSFELTSEQRENLRNYLTRGGFMVASAGCSNRKWADSFKREIKQIFPKTPLKELDLSHPVFHTIYKVRRLVAKRASSNPKLMGLEIDGKIALIYSPDGLNDTANAGGRCCCCGGNEIRNAKQINVNLLAYALTH